MIAFMLDDLRDLSFIILCMFLKRFVLILHFDLTEPLCFSHAIQRKTPFLGLIRLRSLQDHRIDHDNVHKSHGYDDDPLPVSDHIRCHTHTMFMICFQRIPQIRHDLSVRLRCLFGSLPEKKHIPYDRFYHFPALLKES